MPRQLYFDRLLCGTILALMFFGLVMVFSATSVNTENSLDLLKKQGFAAVIGLAAMRGLMFIDYRRFANPRLVQGIAGATVILLILVLFSSQAANTNRFMSIFGYQFQPSELAKLALVVFLSAYLAQNASRLKDWRTVAGAGLIVVILSGLIVWGKDLGTAVCIAVIAGVMLWAAGIRFRYFVIAGVLGVIAMFVLINVEPYRWDRIVAFLHPEEDPLGKNYQIRQSKIAVATGSFLGQGLMDGQQKMYFLPARHTDFIFAVVCEELGFVAAFFLVAAFGVILWRGAAIARHARDDLGRYLAIGVTAMIVCQAMINLGVVLGMLPTKGLPLPFISYGNSALIVFLAASGLLLNVSQHAE